MGLFGPLRYGVDDSLEVELHPILTFLTPHLAVKKQLQDIGSWNFAIRQSLSYPTPLLRILSRGGIGGILPPDSEIPHLLSSDTRILATNDVSEKLSVTLRMQMQFAPRVGDSDFPHIPVPIVYPRIASFNGFASVGLGAYIQGQLNDVLQLRSDTQLWFLGGNSSNWNVEQWAGLRWFAASKFCIDIGIVGTIGDYPYGINWHVIPTFDLNWAFDQ